MDLVHGLLSLPPAARPALNELLAQVADAFDATAAGLAPRPDGTPGTAAVRVGRHGQPSPATPLPWDDDAAFAEWLQLPGAAVVLPRQPRGSLLAAVAALASGPDWLIWVEDERRSTWTPGETAALALFACAFGTVANPGDFPEQLNLRERRLRQQGLEQSAQLVRKLAHDFGNALTSILGFTELSIGQRVAPGSNLQGYLGELHRGVKSAAEWTRHLRLFSLGEPFAQQSASVADAVGAEELTLRAARKPGANLVLDLAAGLPPVAADSEYLREVIRNLLENAFDALPNGKGVVTLTARAVAFTAAECLAYYGRLQPGPHVLVRVTDTGAGLTAEVRRRLFAELFFTTKPRRRGLGLAVAYGIAAASRGGLRLENGPHGGAVAEVVFPLTKVQATNPSPVRVPSRDGVAAPADGDKVLVVDDDPHVRRFVQTTLQRAGYRVHAVATAEEALVSFEAAPRDPFRLVVSDLLMPKTTGADLARQLLKTDANARLLFMTGLEGLDASAENAGLHRFELIHKPFRSERLLQAVRAAIDRIVG